MKRMIKNDTSNIRLSSRLNAVDVKSSVEKLRVLTFEVTEKCNLACEYCAYGIFYNTDDDRQRRDMPFLYIK